MNSFNQLTIDDFRLENMRRFINENGGPTAVSKRLGYSNGSYLVQMTGPNPTRPITEKSARSFEHRLGMKPGSLDQAVEVPPQTRASRPKSKATSEPTGPSHMVDIINTVTSLVKESGAQMSTQKFADLMALAATDAELHQGKVRRDYVNQLIRLAT